MQVSTHQGEGGGLSGGQVDELVADLEREMTEGQQQQAEETQAARGTVRPRGTPLDLSVHTPDACFREVLCEFPAPRGSTDASSQPYDNAAKWLSERFEQMATASQMYIEQMCQEGQEGEVTLAAAWSEAEMLHLERLYPIIKEHELKHKHQLLQAEKKQQQLSLQSVPFWGLEHLAENCPICQEKLGTEGDVVQLQCPQPPGANESTPHLFHIQCITTQVDTNGIEQGCPLCKAPIVQCRSAHTGKLKSLTAEAEAGPSAVPATSLADRAVLRRLHELQQDLPLAPPGSARARATRPNYHESPMQRPPSRARPAIAASAPAPTGAPASASGGSPMPAAQPMETDEPHAAAPPAASTDASVGAGGDGEDGEQGGSGSGSELDQALEAEWASTSGEPEGQVKESDLTLNPTPKS